MSSKQYNLPPSRVINEVSVGDDIASSITEIFNKDNVTYQLAWTGTLLGSFTVSVSTNYKPNTGLGNWDPLPLDPAPIANGSAGSWTLDLNELGSKYIKIDFTYTSGSGDLTADIMGKAI